MADWQGVNDPNFAAIYGSSTTTPPPTTTTTPPPATGTTPPPTTTTTPPPAAGGAPTPPPGPATNPNNLNLTPFSPTTNPGGLAYDAQNIASMQGTAAAPPGADAQGNIGGAATDTVGHLNQLVYLYNNPQAPRVGLYSSMTPDAIASQIVQLTASVVGSGSTQFAGQTVDPSTLQLAQQLNGPNNKYALTPLALSSLQTGQPNIDRGNNIQSGSAGAYGQYGAALTSPIPGGDQRIYEANPNNVLPNGGVTAPFGGTAPVAGTAHNYAPEITALDGYIKNLTAVKNKNPQQVAELTNYTNRLNDYTQKQAVNFPAATTAGPNETGLQTGTGAGNGLTPGVLPQMGAGDMIPAPAPTTPKPAPSAGSPSQSGPTGGSAQSSGPTAAPTPGKITPAAGTVGSGGATTQPPSTSAAPINYAALAATDKQYATNLAKSNPTEAAMYNARAADYTSRIAPAAA